MESRLPDEQHEYGHVEHSLLLTVRDFREFLNSVAEHERRQHAQPKSRQQQWQKRQQTGKGKEQEGGGEDEGVVGKVVVVEEEGGEEAVEDEEETQEIWEDGDPDLNRFTIRFDGGMNRISLYSLSAIPQHLSLHLTSKALRAHKPTDESI